MPTRLAGLAANLARIANFSKHVGHRELVQGILIESKWFIEWTAAELEIERAAELVRQQVLLAWWDLQSRDHWQIDDWRNSLSATAKEWSERILKMSGLAEVKPTASHLQG